MEVNKDIEEVLKTNRINVNLGMGYLFTLHFGYKVDNYSDEFKARMNTTRLVTISQDGKTLNWSLPLFKGQETGFDWVVTEYCRLFASIDKDRFHRESTSRMKKLFSTNPDIRKDEILGATEMYLNNTDPKYVQFPHYFLRKGSGTNTVQHILDWVDKYRIYKQQGTGGGDQFNTLQ